MEIKYSKFEGVVIEGLVEKEVDSIEKCLDILMQGSYKRMESETVMNNNSSRSHTVFQLVLDIVENGKHFKRKINLCDLAGNEKFSESTMFSKDRFREMKSINQSLTTLGKVINILSEDSRGYVPYRESKLTRVLQDSLSGTGQLYLIATVCPTSPHTESSFSTLEFAKRTSKIKTVVTDELEEV
jgi:kinesin family member 11